MKYCSNKHLNIQKITHARTGSQGTDRVLILSLIPRFLFRKRQLRLYRTSKICPICWSYRQSFPTYSKYLPLLYLRSSRVSIKTNKYKRQVITPCVSIQITLFPNPGHKFQPFVHPRLSDFIVKHRPAYTQLNKQRGKWGSVIRPLPPVRFRDWWCILSLWGCVHYGKGSESSNSKLITDSHLNSRVSVITLHLL
jgi:hypothetical protein